MRQVQVPPTTDTDWQAVARTHRGSDPGWHQIAEDPHLIMDTEPINVNPETMTSVDRARLAAHRAAKALFPTYGTEAVHYRGDAAPFSPRRQPDPWTLSNSLLTVWRQACFFSPIGDKASFFPVTAHFNEAGLFHNTKGPAIIFSDGMKIYFIKGIEVGETAVMSPKDIPIAMIRDCKNVEQRRILIECYGKDNYIAAMGLKPIHQDDWGQLFHAEVPNDEPLCMVKVVNNTPEKDGSYKDYWLCVPPSITTAKAAVAWTWAKDEKSFNPVQRS